MRPSCEQLLERHAGDLAAHAVEAGEDHRVGRVVDDEVDAGEVLEGADVAALAADDAALHVVGGELDDGHRRLRRVAGGHALHDDGEDVADAAVGVALGLLLDLAHLARALVADLVLELLRSRICLACEALRPGDALELAHVALAQLDDLHLMLRDLLLARVERAALLVDGRLLRVQALLEPHHLVAALFEVGVGAAGREALGGGSRPAPPSRWSSSPPAPARGARAARPLPPGPPPAPRLRSRSPFSVSSPYGPAEGRPEL